MLFLRLQKFVNTLTGLWLSLIVLLAAACSSTRPPALLPTPIRPASDNVATNGTTASSTTTYDQPIKFDRISLEQGLSQSSINCILQDRQGFMWFGTQDGLNRFDGYSFKVYRHDAADPNSLSDNFVRSITEDATGALWIGTETAGVDKFDRDTGQFTHFPNLPNFVRAVYPDHEGLLWLGIIGDGLRRFDPATNRVTRYTHQPGKPDSLGNDYVQTIYEDRSGTLWIGLDGGGLDRFDRVTGKFSHYQHDATDPNSLSSDAVWAITEDRAGQTVDWHRWRRAEPT